jgi:hypothetical protein
MELINTLEITPWGYTDKEYDLPKGSKMELPEEWSKNWYKCLSDRGLQNLVPIEFASYFIDITTISDFELKVIIQKQLQEIELEENMEYEEYVRPLYGGIVIKENNKIIIEPQCCSDLNDLEEWLDIFNHNEYEWHQLWIGHPWIFYRKQNGYIEFSNYCEDNKFDAESNVILCRIAENWLKSELNTAKANQIILSEKVAKILQELNLDKATTIAKLFVP